MAEPLAKLGVSFGSAAARFKVIFGKGGTATPSETGQETGRSQAVPAAEPEATVLQSPTSLPSDEPAAVLQSAFITSSNDLADQSPSSVTHLEGVLEKDTAVTSAVPERETGQPRVVPAADLEATVLQSRTILQSENPTLAPQSIPIVGSRVEVISHPSVEFHETISATIQDRHRLDEEPVLEKVVEVKRIPEPQDFPKVMPMAAMTVITASDETISEMTVLTPAPKREVAGVRWKWISGGATVAALLAGLVYYHWLSAPPSQDKAASEQTEVLAKTPKPPSADVVEQAVPEVASSDTRPEREPIKNAAAPTKTKLQDVIKAPIKEKSSAIKIQEIAKGQETVRQLKEPPKSEPDKTGEGATARNCVDKADETSGTSRCAGCRAPSCFIDDSLGEERTRRRQPRTSHCEGQVLGR